MTFKCTKTDVVNEDKDKLLISVKRVYSYYNIETFQRILLDEQSYVHIGFKKDLLYNKQAPRLSR
jgi:hypothetical protein